MNLGHYLMLVTKFDLKWTVEINVEAKTIKQLEENGGKSLSERPWCRPQLHMRTQIV